MDTVVKKIKDLLKKNDILQKDFAKDVGVSVVTINSILTNKQGIKVEILKKMADVLGVSICYFFGENNKNQTILIKQIEKLQNEINDKKKIIELYESSLEDIADIFTENRFLKEREERKLIRGSILYRIKSILKDFATITEYSSASDSATIRNFHDFILGKIDKDSFLKEVEAINYFHKNNIE